MKGFLFLKFFLFFLVNILLTTVVSRIDIRDIFPAFVAAPIRINPIPLHSWGIRSSLWQSFWKFSKSSWRSGNNGFLNFLHKDLFMHYQLFIETSEQFCFSDNTVGHERKESFRLEISYIGILAIEGMPRQREY